MNWLRLHWFDVGIVLAFPVAFYLLVTPQRPISVVLWLNLIALFLHQLEEYRYPGYFPGMMNVVMFNSQAPDRYPLNTNTALLVNVVEGWFIYALAALLSERLPWLGIAAVLISAGNILAHTFLFNVRGKTVYNPGLATSLLLFLPLAVAFFALAFSQNFATPLDWIVGVVLGVVLNYVGVVKLIEWLGDVHTSYIFPKRSLPPRLRK